jgi:oligopeptide transport system ATP-binding protein
VPSPANPPSGCRFHTRCWKAQDKCTTDIPLLQMRPDGVGEHLSACHFASPREVIETVDVSDQEVVFKAEIRDDASFEEPQVVGDGTSEV